MFYKKRGEVLTTYKKIKIYIGDEYYNQYNIQKLNEQEFVYNDDACINKIEINSQKVTVTRESEEFLLIIESDMEDAYYKLKELNYELKININYFDFFEEDNKLIIAYQLETNDQPIKLELEGD